MPQRDPSASLRAGRACADAESSAAAPTPTAEKVARARHWALAHPDWTVAQLQAALVEHCGGTLAPAYLRALREQLSPRAGRRCADRQVASHVTKMFGDDAWLVVLRTRQGPVSETFADKDEARRYLAGLHKSGFTALDIACFQRRRLAG